MKTLLSFLILTVGLSITAQTTNKKAVMLAQALCSECTSSDYDKVTGKTTAHGRQLFASDDGKTGFMITALKFNTGEMAVVFELGPRSGCIEKYTDILFLFKDGSRLTTNSSRSEFSCDGSVPIYFGGSFKNEDLLKTLDTKALETVRIMTGRSHIQADLKEEDAAELVYQLKCLETNSFDKFQRPE